MWTLSGFGDEIDPEPEVHLPVLASEGIRYLDLRAAWGTNVLALSDDQLTRLAILLADHGVQVSAVASPLGKSPIGEAVGPTLDGLRRALDVAEMFGAPFVRVFSFYPPAGEDPERSRSEVIDRLGRMVREAEAADRTLLHENEKGIYGDTPARCLDLLASVDSPRLRAAWDPANFVQVGVRPFADGFAALRPFVAYVHVKDALLETGEVVPAGEGDGEWRPTLAALKESGYDGFFSLEPHLKAAGPSSGFSGPDLFRTAAGALQGLLREQGIAWA